MNTLSLPLPVAYKAKCGPKGSAIEGSFGTFATAFEEAQQVLTRRRLQRGLWKFFEFFKNASAPSSKAIREYLDPLVRKALEEKDAFKSIGKDRPEDSTDSFLRHLAMSTNSEPFDFKV